MTGHTYGEKLSDFKVGDRVELHPETDLWKRGNRFGVVEVIGKRYVVPGMNAHFTFLAE